MRRRLGRLTGAVAALLALVGAPAGAQVQVPLEVQQVDAARHPHVSILLAISR